MRLEGLRPLVADSWRRCLAAGLSPSAPLRPAAEAGTPWTGAEVGSADLLLLLCDGTGTVRSLSASAHLMRRAAAAGLRVGVSLTEAAAGTNAVGTAMVERRPVEIRDDEHFLTALRPWRARGAAVCSEGRLVGYASVWWAADREPLAERVELYLRLGAACCREHAARAEIAWVLRLLGEGADPARGHVVVDGSGAVRVATPAARRLLGAGDLDDLSRALPYLWQQVRRFVDTGLRTDLTLRPPAVAATCRVSARRLPECPELVALTVCAAQGAGRPRHGELTARYRFEDIITVSANMRRALATARAGAATDAPILLQGESGTGKELVAQAIHRASPRAAGPFVALNCAAFPRDLVVSELFGYEEGAFTGARRRGAPGRFEQADGGTIFLDEIGEMSPDHQAMLLRVLEDGLVVRLGGDRPRRVDVRVVAATHRDLWREVEQGRFRADLYYRLNVISVSLPPLRERPEDVPVLAAAFLEREARALGKDLSWAAGALEALRRYRWPGNVRELYNVVKRAAILAPAGSIGVESLPLLAIGPAAPARQPRRRRVRRQDLELALGEAEGNVSEAARLLGVARSTIYRARKRATANKP